MFVLINKVKCSVCTYFIILYRFLFNTFNQNPWTAQCRSIKKSQWGVITLFYKVLDLVNQKCKKKTAKTCNSGFDERRSLRRAGLHNFAHYPLFDHFWSPKKC